MKTNVPSSSKIRPRQKVSCSMTFQDACHISPIPKLSPLGSSARRMLLVCPLLHRSDILNYKIILIYD